MRNLCPICLLVAFSNARMFAANFPAAVWSRCCSSTEWSCTPSCVSVAIVSAWSRTLRANRDRSLTTTWPIRPLCCWQYLQQLLQVRSVGTPRRLFVCKASIESQPRPSAVVAHLGLLHG
jgi:hypothetical protein